MLHRVETAPHPPPPCTRCVCQRQTQRARSEGVRAKSGGVGLPRAALPRPAPRLTPRRLAREAVSIVLSVKYALGLSLIVYLRKYLVGRQWVGRPIILCVCRALAPLRRVKNCRFGVRGAGVVFLFIAASGVSCVPVLSGAVSVSFVSTRLHSRKKESLANVVYP